MSEYTFDFNLNRIYKNGHEVFRAASPTQLKKIQKKVNEVVYSYVNDNREWLETITTKKDGLTELSHKEMTTGKEVIYQKFDFTNNVNTLRIDIPELDQGVDIIIRYLRNN